MDIQLINRSIVPLFASNISLLFALMSRNAMISQRIREMCKELASNECEEERSKSLSKQIVAFDERYASNKWAIVSVLTAVVLFMIGIFLSSGLFDFLRETDPVLIEEVFVPLSFLAFFLAISLTFWDFIRATETLEEEIRYSRKCHERRLRINKQSVDTAPLSRSPGN